MKNLVELGNAGCGPLGCNPVSFASPHTLGEGTVKKIYTPFGVRCQGSNGKFVACKTGMGSTMFPGVRNRMGQLEATLPVVGKVSVPKQVQFDLWPGLGGAVAGKILPGITAGLLGNLLGPKGETATKIVIGLATAASFLSPKVRRSSFMTGFGIIVLIDMITPFVGGLVDAIVPPSLAGMGAAISPGDRAKLIAAEKKLAIRTTDPRFVQAAGVPKSLAAPGSRTIMLPSDYAGRAASASPMNGPSWMKGII